MAGMRPRGAVSCRPRCPFGLINGIYPPCCIVNRNNVDSERRPGPRRDRGRGANPPAMVRLENISKSYIEGSSRREVLRDAALTLEPGTFSALLGASGSGKSSLLNLVAGLDRPDAGRIWVGDQELTALNDTQFAWFRRRRLGFVFQFFHLFPTLTVAENLDLILELAGHRDDSERPRVLLQRVGLWERRDSYPDVLSGGEQQRVAVARALVHRPQLVLADEPTGNLDAPNGAVVLDLLKQLSRDEGVTLLVATHSQEVAEAADRTLRLLSGKIVDE